MSAGRSSTTGGRRRRRTPEVAEQEILNAAEELLRQRPFRDLTVDEVMRRTDLSRPSFYVYFRDRHHLILRIVERLGGEHVDIGSMWYGRAGSGPEQIREAVAATVEIWERDGPVLHALADAAADDPDVELAHRAIMDASVSSAARHIEEQMATGTMLPVDALETARALSIMTDRYLVATLGRNPIAKPEVVVETLSTIWIRTLYGEGLPSSA
jgi:TetR/AcrR family transcriptional regulator, ethionamide resistance regulator